MLQITMDVFSGRPNPSWVVTDDAEVRAIFQAMADNRAALSQEAPTEMGLGFRGIVVEPLFDGGGQDSDLDARAYIPVGSNTAVDAILDRIISVVSNTQQAFSLDAEAITAETEFLSFLQQQLMDRTRDTMDDTEGAFGLQPPAEAAAALAICQIENYPFNPGFWNNDATVRSSNNCYNYASNKRTNTFAQPGRGCGNMYKDITCTEVTRASLCDGLHHRYDCFPPSEAPRHLVALVIAPGPAFKDFHWYRLHREGFWGHKPGGTAARNTDNSNRIILDPRSCNRGPYTQFCGFFYTCRSQRIR
jgi:hypothetical protein